MSDPADQKSLMVESLSKRAMLKLGAGSIALAAFSQQNVANARSREIRAVAFDGIAVFDIRPMAAMAETLFPGRGAELTNAWRTRQFEYTWLRTMMNDYADFHQVSEESLSFAAKLLKLDFPKEKKVRMLDSIHEIRAWPDVLTALKSLKERGIRMALLSNFTTGMLKTATRNSELDFYLEEPLSTDLVKAYKPDPRAYAMALDAFKLPKEEIAFVAFAGWDAVGAKRFGYSTYWANRMGLPEENLDASPDFVSRSFEDLERFCLIG